MATNASSITSPLADMFPAVNLPPQVDYVIEQVASVSWVTWLCTLLAMAVVYDQGTRMLLSHGTLRDPEPATLALPATSLLTCVTPV